MFLREDEHLVVEKAPVAGVLADSDDGDQEARGRSEIRSLSYSTRGLVSDELEGWVMTR